MCFFLFNLPQITKNWNAEAIRCSMARMSWVGGLTVKVAGMDGRRVLRCERDLGWGSPMTVGRAAGRAGITCVVRNVRVCAYHHVT